MTILGCTSYIAQSIARSDKSSWQIAGDYLEAHFGREAALVAAISDLADDRMPDVLIYEDVAFKAKEVLYFIATRPVIRNEPNI